VRPPEREPLEPAAFRRVMGQFATGVTVLTARAGAMVHGMTANAVASASLAPMLVVCAIDRRARMLELLAPGQRFAVNVLDGAHADLARRFAGAAPQSEASRIRFWPTGPEDAPVLVGAMAAVRCEVERRFDAGDHELVLGRVTELFGGGGRDDPLIFYRGRFRRLRALPAGAEGPQEEMFPEGLRLHYDEW
jgi:flavin reductase (DIM6/NTAB) family NADH-FMN oxidoreductase RutF